MVLPDKAVSEETRANCRILLTTTTWWTLATRLSAAFSQYSSNVSVLCPAGHPARFLQTRGPIYDYAPFAPEAALARAIASSRPDLVIPCDDRAVRHLHHLHRTTPALRPVIERSLGRPEGYGIANVRSRLLGLAAATGLAVPETAMLRDQADFDAFAARQPFPWVLKLDHSWGGRGVRIVADRAAALRAWQSMRHARGLRDAAKAWLVNRDAYPAGEWRRQPQAAISAQAFITGRPANCLAACWNGTLLGLVGAEVLGTTDPTGAATVVRLIDNPQMTQAARTLVDRLGVSGFCGFDFMLDHATGQAWLIEMNPRVTQLGHLPLGPGRDLVAALLGRLTGAAVTPAPALAGETIAFFPGALRQSPPSSHLALAYHDVPDDAALVRELLRTPWTNRSLASRLHGWVQKRRAGGVSGPVPARVRVVPRT